MPESDHFFLNGDEPFFELNTGTNAAPVWVSIDLAEEVSLDVQKGKSEFKPRSVRNKLKRGAKQDWPLSFKYPVTRGADTIRDALYDTMINHTPLQFAVSDKGMADAGSFGFKAYYEVMKYPLNLNAEEGFMIDIEADETDYVEGGSLIAPVELIPS